MAGLGLGVGIVSGIQFSKDSFDVRSFFVLTIYVTCFFEFNFNSSDV
ncbi:MAG: hypothetical protein JWR68_128 [Polaromonas sp.]|nr:hypothetical protein [Polaromonas sp.]